MCVSIYVRYLCMYVCVARIAYSMVEFRFLNSSSPILVGKGPAHDEASEHQLLTTKLSDSPSGGTVQYSSSRLLYIFLMKIQKRHPTVSSHPRSDRHDSGHGIYFERPRTEGVHHHRHRRRGHGWRHRCGDKNYLVSFTYLGMGRVVLS